MTHLTLCASYDILGPIFIYFFLAAPQGMWDLSSSTRDRTCTPCIGSAGSSPWITTEAPVLLVKSNNNKM